MINKFRSSTKKSRGRIAAIVRKELDWVIHDKLSMLILFLLPIFLIIMVGNIQNDIRSGSDEPAIVYLIDKDFSNFSSDYIQSLRSDELTFELYDNHEDPDKVTIENAEKLIPTPDLQAYLIIPEDFNESLLLNRTAKIKVYIDGIKLFNSLQLKYEFVAGTMLYQLEYQVFNSEVLYFPETRPDRDLTLLEIAVPNMVPTIMFAALNMIACQCIIADEPLKRMLITPTKKWEVIIAKTIAYCFLGAILSFGCMCLLTFGFGLQFISFIDTYMMAFFATIFGVTLGILFSCIAKSRLQAAQMFLFSYIMITLFVNYLRIEPIVHYMPTEIISSIFIHVAYRGIPLSSLGAELSLIIGMNASFLILAYIALSLKKQDV
ncbi:MAG: ABC transporter permease [Promethearchaeota archaeon]